MAWDLVLEFSIKAGATALLLLAATLLARRAGAFLTAVIVTLPLNAGPGFLFVALEASGDFVAASALVSFAATLAVFAFTAGFAHASVRVRSFWTAWAAGSFTWSLVAVPILNVAWQPLTAFLAVAIGYGIAHLLRCRAFDDPVSDVAPKRTDERLMLVVRSVIGGSAVALTAVLADWLGPALTGLAFGYPVALSATGWMLARAYSVPFAGATLSNARTGILSYATFCFSLGLLATAMSPLLAWTLALAASVVAGALLALVPRRALSTRTDP